MLSLYQLCERFAALVPKKPEAPSWAPFGEYAWASSREGMLEEPDTEIENKVYDAIKKHFASKRTGLPTEIVELLSMCVVLEWYQPVLHPPPNKVLYRGLKIKTREGLAKILGTNDFEDEGSMDFEDHVVPPENGCSTSWTAKKKITKDFSEKGARGWAVTLIADVEPNKYRFLAGPGGLYDVDGLSRWHLEKETVGLEPIKIKKIEWRKL